MTHIPIEINGDCIDRLIKRLEKQIGLKEANQLKETAIEVVQNCVKVYSENFGDGDVGKNSTGLVSQPYKGINPIPNGTTGLIYGRVQSGKTNTTIATLALAHENNFRCFIVLTSNNTWLGEQTANRFNNQIQGGPVIFDWEAWKKDPVYFAKTKVIPYIKDTGVVLVTTKNVSHLKRLLIVLKTAKVKIFPTLIFDDEADNASLNTNESKQSKQGKETIPDSSTFEQIHSNIRQEIPNHIYIQITATPQSLLLQNLPHPCKPKFCAALPKPGDAYMGGDLFFSEQSKHCVIIDSEEINQIKKQKGAINPGNKWIIPEGIRLALCCFFLGATYKILSSDDEDATYSFLVHICYKQDIHASLEQVISNFVINLDKAIREKSSRTDYKQAIKWLEEAYKELDKTADKLPALNKLIDELKIQLRHAIPKIINANNPDKEPNYNPGMNILIGGNRLGRGVTIEGLMVTYYGRDAKQKTVDTVHQHARMYGYRPHLKDVTRLFLAEHILDAFRSIHEADEAMRQAIGDDIHNIKVQPVWIGGHLKPTRSNVLDPSVINVLRPGKLIFAQDPAYKKEDIEPNFKAIENFLINYQDDEEYTEVDIDFIIKIISHTKSYYVPSEEWEDNRIIKALTNMKSKGMDKGRLNVRRGKKNNKEGLDLLRKDPFKWMFGFGSGGWSIEAQKKYPDVATLIICYQKGEKINGWDDHPIYLPMLVLPKQKFVFMFNYDEDE
ncbi:Z1 domain-containing protein [Trichormus variabilis]|uniref:DEAD/DEAH box helicase n=1 Tax=Trichormus variabilis SAG 1403-4b TaxID=447716 RepID=A0A3S1A535_ANAVA|nr:Z1 domain-containing protein [Trichormus variabilis]MBD2629382.1 Z1 domain-containing protein [Trichormus variabilis FACHB-164]RUS93542.1 DEAD/DEAH box helicase [Trichormus variabilis SAG 1403-4b]